MKSLYVNTLQGQVVLDAAPDVLDSRDPVALLIHGAFRTGETMRPLAQRLARPVVYARLPAHEAPELDEKTAAGWTSAFSQAIRSALPRPVLAVGESLGGVLAIGLRGVAGVVAIDPFLRTSHLWPVERYLAPDRAGSQDYGALQILRPGNDFSAFAYERDGDLDVVAGDVPLGEPRVMDKPPSLLDDQDAEFLGRFGRVVRLPGGHDVLTRSLDAVAEIVRARLDAVSASA